MRYSTNLVSLRTFALAFALVLTPAFMQIEPDCGGDTTLAALEFKPFQMPGADLPEDMIVEFDPQVRLYEVVLPSNVHQAMLVVEASDPTAELAVQCYSDEGFVEGHQIDEALGWTVVDLPDGNSRLKVFVRPIGGAEEDCYIIRITRGLTP